MVMFSHCQMHNQFCNMVILMHLRKQEMEQMVLFTQMKYKGHLSESPLGDWKTMLSAASLLETLVGLMA
uniref:Alternative protein TAX1BP1 n=1 Tax=Homo sapiens TaxID=9606 RepID=L8E7U3_HUMAN|nr:alternative protein TAX1BP1 [Homo sapiens]